MTIFVPGNGTLKSVTLEAAFVEACQRLELAEEASADPGANNFTAVDPDNVTGQFTVQCNLRISVVPDNTGKPVITATEYIQPIFANGGGDLKSTTLQGGVLELAQKIQNLESSSNPAVNNLQVTYNTEAGLAVITATIPYTVDVTPTGSIEYVVTPYLA